MPWLKFVQLKPLRRPPRFRRSVAADRGGNRRSVPQLTDRETGDGYSRAMTVKYYTQFRLTDASYWGGNEFSGVVELNRPMDQYPDVADIEAVLAKNFDLRRDSVKLLSWARLH